MKEALINLALSKEPSNYEIFHQYHSLEDKLTSLEWFWDVKCHELPWDYCLLRDKHSETYIMMTDILFDYCIEFHRLETHLGNNVQINFYNTINLIMSHTTIENIKNFLENFVTEEHYKRHK